MLDLQKAIVEDMLSSKTTRVSGVQLRNKALQNSRAEQKDMDNNGRFPTRIQL